MKMLGTRAVVTGASQGLGLAIAQAYVREGASVMICGRHQDTLDAALELLEGRVHAMRCDLACERDIETLAREAQARMGGVDVLVANAGVYGPLGALEDVDWREWVHAIQINLTGTVYCCRVFLPLLRESSRAKVLILSGGGATKPLPFISAYAASKAAIVRFGETLAEELKPLGIDVNMIAPGALNTRLLHQVLEAGPEKVGEEFHRASLKQLQSGGTPLDVAAELCVHLAVDAHGISGKLISAQWDPWREFARFKEALMSSDIYTLRRILPGERGQNWNVP